MPFSSLTFSERKVYYIYQKASVKKGDVVMKFLGNLLWFIFGGFLSGMSWIIAGIIWCITIVGVPVGVQCFKFAVLTFAPFGKNVEYNGGAGTFLLNVLWVIFSGAVLAMEHLLIGVLLCMTIVGIPFGCQQFKLVRLAIMPFGADIVHN